MLINKSKIPYERHYIGSTMPAYFGHNPLCICLLYRQFVVVILQHRQLNYNIYEITTMKYRLTFFLFILAINIHIFAQDIEYITYNESYQSYPSLISYAPLRAKAMRKTDNHGGQISINYNSSNNIPDSLKQAIEIAALLWEECLPVEAKITIDVGFGNNLSDMSVTVPYINCSNDTIYALSYYNTYKGNFTQYNEGMVLFSDAIDWCCQYSQGNGNNKKCLSTAMLRAIAITLGFGSTVKKNNQGALYYEIISPGYTPFEYLK